MRDVLADLRYACRSLGHARLFSVVVVLTLALGIGANSAIFSIVNGVVLNGLPFTRPPQLVSLQVRTDKGYAGAVSLPNYHDWQRETRSFSSMAAASTDGFTLATESGAQHVVATLMIGDVFGTLGVRPVLGRAPSADETQRGAASTVVLSYAFWQRQFGGSSLVIGRSRAANHANGNWRCDRRSAPAVRASCGNCSRRRSCSQRPAVPRASPWRR